MKAHFAALLLLAASLLFSACESDLPPDNGDNGAEKFRRGITGQGSLTEPDRSEDPVIREDSRVGN